VGEIIRADKVALRPAVDADKRMIYEWAHHSDIAHWLHWPPKDRIETYQEWCEDWKPHYFNDEEPRRGRLFVIMRDDEPIGATAYNTIDDENNRVEVDIWMSCEKNCEKGHGPDALRALIKYLHQTHGVDQAWLQPSAQNPRAIRAYEKAGFRRVDITPEEAVKEYGPRDYEDSVVMVNNI
jgi:RimJ/RimL family protein N-acetyltransferase